jgi:hypothetical protein
MSQLSAGQGFALPERNAWLEVECHQLTVANSTTYLPCQPPAKGSHAMPEQTEGTARGGPTMNESTLYEVLVAYLKSNGFHVASNGLWGHRELGEGRTFEQVVMWQIGREQAGRD